MGLTEQPKAVGQNQLEPLEKFGVKTISVGLLNPGDRPLIWRGPMLHSIIRQFLQQVVWGELDYLLIDLPPGTGDVAISLIQTVPVTGSIVVCTPSDVALQDARKAIEMFKQLKVDLLGLVENMSYFVCPHCQHEVDIFSKGGGERTAAQFGVPFLGAIGLDPSIRRAGDTGQPLTAAGDSAQAKAFGELATRVMQRVDEENAAHQGGVIRVV
jgi:ATP-binding protein involved in chromosome partitioning